MNDSAVPLEADERWYSKVWDFLRWPYRRIKSIKNVANPVLTRLTREGLQFVFMISFVLIGAVLRDVNLLVILAGTMLAMMLIQWRVCARTLYRISATRRLPRVMQARKVFEIELSLKNPRRWLGAWLVLAQERLVYAPEQNSNFRASQAIGMLFMSIPPKSSRTQHYRCVAQRRGRYQFMELELTTRFPMGLMRGIQPIKSTETFVVQPAIGRILYTWTELLNVRSSGAKHRRVRSLSDEAEFYGLRDYRSGDSTRWIHWRSSARRAGLVVKQFQQPESQEIVLVLDLNQSKTDAALHDRLESQKIEDTAVEFVATLVHHIASTNIGMITVAVADFEATVAARIQSRSSMRAILDRLGIAQSTDKETLSETLRKLEQVHQRVEKLIVVSTRAKSDRFDFNGTDGDQSTVFWRSSLWLDSSADDLSKYFARAE